MKVRILVCLVAVSSVIQGNARTCYRNEDLNVLTIEEVEYFKNMNCVFVPLGSFCRPAAALKSLGIRKVSLPFDWCVTSFDALYKILEHDFKNFVNPKFLTLGKSEEQIRNSFYGFNFFHVTFEFAGKRLEVDQGFFDPDRTHLVPVSLQGEEFLDQFTSKFKRRVNRFYELMTLGVPVYFIREKRTTEREAVALRDLFRKKFPNLEFKIIILDTKEEYLRWENNHSQIIPCAYYTKEEFQKYKAQEDECNNSQSYSGNILTHNSRLMLRALIKLGLAKN